jgi:hypothetical protein
MNLKQYLCEWLGCNDSDCEKELRACLTQNDYYKERVVELKSRIEQLESLIPRPVPQLDHIVEKNTAWLQAVLAQYEPSIIRLPLGPELALTEKDTFLEWVAWNWVDEYEYHKFYRCGNFAISFKADADRFGINGQVGIVIDYQAGHAYNLVVFPDGEVMLLEPQSDNIWYWEDKDLPFYVLKGAFVII